MKRALAIILLLGALAVLAACQLPLPPRPPSGPTATSIFAQYTPQPSVEVASPEAPTAEAPSQAATLPAAPTSEEPSASPTAAATSAQPAPTQSAPTATQPAATQPAATAAPAQPTPTATGAPQVQPTLAAGALLPAANLALPARYTLQRGEFPYCIARRYNVNPYELMRLNGFSFHQIFYPGQVVRLPQTGNPWPVARAWHAHTSTYTVRASNETFNSVACFFGDIDPAALAQINGMEIDAKLTKGQALTLVP